MIGELLLSDENRRRKSLLSRGAFTHVTGHGGKYCNSLWSGVDWINRKLKWLKRCWSNVP